MYGRNETYCGLRDFPPIPNGYGEARMLCGGQTAAFDPYWMWKITKVRLALDAETRPMGPREAG